MPDDGDVIPVDEALRSVEWAMRQTAEVRKQRDTYRKLWEAADRAFRAYVAEVGPIIQRGPGICDGVEDRQGSGACSPREGIQDCRDERPRDRPSNGARG